MTIATKALLGAAAQLLLASVVPATAAGLDELAAAAKKEGQLTVIALPRDWCGYGALIDSFKAKYGIAVAVEAGLAQQPDCQAGLSGAGFADEQNVVGPAQEVQPGQCLDLRPAHAGLSIEREAVE